MLLIYQRVYVKTVVVFVSTSLYVELLEYITCIYIHIERERESPHDVKSPR